MLFQAEHIEQIRRGEKTQTRRLWESRQAKPGSVHIASTELFTSHDEANCYIRIEDVWTELLREMTVADADAEGGYTLAEFKQVWRDINGVWDPGQEVTVVEFEYVGRERDGGDD